jgi:hypothetical protein
VFRPGSGGAAGPQIARYRTTELYAAFDPAYLQNAVRAIDLLFGSFAPVDEPFFRAVRRQHIEIDWQFGAGEGIRTPDPNLGKTASPAQRGTFPRIRQASAPQNAVQFALCC